MTKKNKAYFLGRLKTQRDEVEQIITKKSFSQEYKKWRRDTEVLLEYTFGIGTRHVTEFNEIDYSPSFWSTSTPDSYFEEVFRTGLETAKTTLQSMIDEIEEYWNDDERDNQLESKESLRVLAQPAMTQYTSRENIDVLIVSALKDELQYLVNSTNISFSDMEIEEGFGLRYWRGSLKTDDISQEISLVAVTGDKMGLVEMSIIMGKALTIWKPQSAYLIGICGGRKSKGVELGDIIIPNHVFHYSFGAIEKGELHSEIKSEAIKEQTLLKLEKLMSDDNLFSLYQGYTNSIGKPRSLPKIHTAPLGSADLVLKDTTKLEGEASRIERKVIAVDMEAYAFARTARAFGCNEIVVIKCVSDFADEQKDDSVREYAMYIPTAILEDFLKYSFMAP